jgi:hypothetical protein
MIVMAVRRGAPEERLARALNINIKTLQEKRRLFDGICPEAAELLKDKQVTPTSFRIHLKLGLEASFSGHHLGVKTRSKASLKPQKGNEKP